MTHHTFPVRRAAILSVVLTLLVSSIAAAQTPSASPAAAPGTGLVWSVEFAQRVTGRHLIVTTLDGRRYEGVVNVSPDSLETTGKNAATVALNQIVRIEKPTYRMRKGAWLGAAAGAALGMLACVSSCDDEPELFFALGAVWGGIGAGVGAGIGAALNHAHRNDDILFDSNRRMTRVAVTPILSPARKGVAVRVSWR